MIYNTDSAAGVAATSAPGLLYAAWVYMVGLPIEKWVSAATLAFVLTQWAFLLRDRRNKRREKRGHQ